MSMCLRNCYLLLPSLYHVSPDSVPPTWVVVVVVGGSRRGGGGGSNGRGERSSDPVVGLSVWNVDYVTWNLILNSLYDSEGL